MTEAEYEEFKIELADLRKQYNDLSAFERKKPYIGQQMARDISRITLAMQEHDRLKKRSES